MPYRHDFSELYGRGEIEVKPNGWIPLTIEFGYAYLGSVPNLYWRVKETEHTFRIPVNTLNEISKGDYEGHIEHILENFRQEYLAWAASGFQVEWMREYHREYRKHIKI